MSRQAVAVVSLGSVGGIAAACLAGRPLEVDALTGAIVAAGERHGIATPLNRALLALLRAVNDAAGNN